MATFSTVGDDVLRTTALIALVLTAACFLSAVVWAAFGAVINRFLGTAMARSVFNWSMAGLLAISLVPVFW
jgi:threonine/homoserine/homoserine lactone efflux protein